MNVTNEIWLDLPPQQPGQTYHQIRYDKILQKTELDALYKFNFDTPKYLVVHNELKKTNFGEIKAFRLVCCNIHINNDTDLTRAQP